MDEIDIEQKRRTISVSDLSPQEEWWKENLLAAYLEIEALKQQRNDLLDACIEAEMILESDPRYPGFADTEHCDCGHCTICRVRVAIAKAKT